MSGSDAEVLVKRGGASAPPALVRRLFKLLGGSGPGSAVDARRAARSTLFLFLGPALLLYLAFTVYPVLRTFWNSFHTIKPHNVEEFIGLANFHELLAKDVVFWKAVDNTAIFAIVATIADVVGGLLLALCLFSLRPRVPPPG